MLVKLSSLVGGNPEWHSHEPLTINFKKVSAAETLQALWDKVRLPCICQMSQICIATPCSSGMLYMLGNCPQEDSIHTMPVFLVLEVLFLLLGVDCMLIGGLEVMTAYSIGLCVHQGSSLLLKTCAAMCTVTLGLPCKIVSSKLLKLRHHCNFKDHDCTSTHRTMCCTVCAYWTHPCNNLQLAQLVIHHAEGLLTCNTNVGYAVIMFNMACASRRPRRTSSKELCSKTLLAMWLQSTHLS